MKARRMRVVEMAQTGRDEVPWIGVALDPGVTADPRTLAKAARAAAAEIRRGR